MKQRPADPALRAATNWFVQLTSDDVTDKEREQWQQWLKADPANQQAWQKIERVTSQFTGLDAKTSIAILNDKTQISYQRRQTLKYLSVLFMASGSGWFAYKEKPWQTWLADYATQTGEIKTVQLDDGTQLILNTDSKVLVDYTSECRLVTLLQGEIHITTAKEQSEVYRPFMVKTEHGHITALGTQFNTRLYPNQSCVSVYEHAVEIVLSDNNNKKNILNAGESIKFNNIQLHEKNLFDNATNAWTKGFLIVDKMPLKDFVEELSRYKSGFLRCDPSIAQLEISGAFPVNDIDAALQSISNIYPLRVENFTSFFTSIKPA